MAQVRTIERIHVGVMDSAGNREMQMPRGPRSQRPADQTIWLTVLSHLLTETVLLVTRSGSTNHLRRGRERLRTIELGSDCRQEFRRRLRDKTWFDRSGHDHSACFRGCGRVLARFQ